MPRILGFPTESDRRLAKESARPLMLGLSMGPRCNLGCIYCNRVPDKAGPSHLNTFVPRRRAEYLTIKDYVGLFQDAWDAGVRYVKISRVGEPFLDSLLWDQETGSFPLIELGSKLGFRFLIYTNGLAFDLNTARRLAAYDVSLVTKCASLTKTIDDELKGKESKPWPLHGGLRIPPELKTLMVAGFNDVVGDATRMGVNVIITKRNLTDIPPLVDFLVSQNIWVEMELLAPEGLGARLYEDFRISEEENRWLFAAIKELIPSEDFGWILEREETGYNECAIMESGVYLDLDGTARICSDIPERARGTTDIGNVRDVGFAELFNKSISVRKRLLPTDPVDRRELTEFQLCAAGLYFKGEGK